MSKRMQVVSDPQQRLVYSWERIVVATLPAANIALDMEHVRALARWIVPEVSMDEVRPAGPGSATGSAVMTRFPEWARRPWVVVHEMAHLRVRRTELELGLSRSPGHGARWMGCYLALVRDHFGADADALVASANATELRVGDSIFPAPSGAGQNIRDILLSGVKSVEELERQALQARRSAIQQACHSATAREAAQDELADLQLRLRMLKSLPRHSS
jgi:hypothetical protein